MKVNITLDINAATGDITSINATTEEGKPVTTDTPTITYPYYDSAALHTFQTKEEHEDWKRRVAQRDQNLADAQAQIVADQAVLQPGALDIATLTKDDLKFLWTFGMELYADVGPMRIQHLFNSWMDSGRQDDGTGHVPPVVGIPGTEGWTVEEHQKARDGSGGWDWSSYQGPLRARLAKRRNVEDI